MMTHDEVSELLGAYALDAVDPEEAERIEEHLAACPRCRDELRKHTEVVGLLAYAGQDAPEGLWDRVMAGIHEAGDDSRLAGSERGGQASPVLPLVGGGERRPGRRRPGRSGQVGRTGQGGRIVRGGGGKALLAGLAAAAVAVVALLGVEVIRLQDRTNHLSGQITAMGGQPTLASVRHALAVPGAQRVALHPFSGGAASLEAVVLPGGQGYLYDSRLAPLPSSETYQLWGVVGDQRISYGVLGSSPAQVVSFRASQGVKALAVTAEVAGGVVTSSQAPVVVGFM